MPAICPVMRRWISGTMEYTAPQAPCTNTEVQSVTATASATPQPALTLESSR